MSNKVLLLLPLLGKAVGRLEDALKQPKNEFMRDSCIQRFEFTYELVWKTLKAYLLEEKGLDVYSPKDCLKEAFAAGFIEDEPLWMKTVELRNLTTHTYREEVAEEIYAVLPQVLALYRRLLKKLEAS